MKKNCLVFLSIIPTLLLGLVSCGNNGDSHVTHLDYGTIRETDITTIKALHELTYDELTSKINHKDSFVLVTYHDGCGCWTDFDHDVLTPFINETHLNIEYMNITSFNNKNNYGLFLVPVDMPGIAIFNRGKLTVNVWRDGNVNPNYRMFNDLKLFKKFMEEVTVYPKMYYVEEAVLDEYISSNKEFNLYFGRASCPDCQEIDNMILRKWNDEVTTVNNPLYLFDLQPFFTGGGYQDKLDKYGLSEVNNSELGYDIGHVPTLQHRKGSVIDDMCVVFNDKYSSSEGKITKTYFTSSRVSHMKYLQGVSFQTVFEDMQMTYAQYQKYNETYHYPIANRFISYYIN